MPRSLHGWAQYGREERAAGFSALASQNDCVCFGSIAVNHAAHRAAGLHISSGIRPLTSAQADILQRLAVPGLHFGPLCTEGSPSMQLPAEGLPFWASP